MHHWAFEMWLAQRDSYYIKCTLDFLSTLVLKRECQIYVICWTDNLDRSNYTKYIITIHFWFSFNVLTCLRNLRSYIVGHGCHITHATNVQYAHKLSHVIHYSDNSIWRTLLSKFPQTWVFYINSLQLVSPLWLVYTLTYSISFSTLQLQYRPKTVTLHNALETMLSSFILCDIFQRLFSPP